ncbi:MAG TPA: transposase [Rhodanobacteraceae bacterium]|nr:transposase [Rhodanobacteraceae bacterium]
MNGIPTPDHAGHRALRHGRISLSGQVYLLTTVTAQRLWIFAAPRLARASCKVIASHATWGGSILLAWILMPDHWHGMLQLGHEPLPLAMNRFKALVTQVLRRECGVVGPIWARGFHDHALRRDEDMHAAARYIIANPVRAGLVRSVGDYPYWNVVGLDPDTAPQLLLL